MNPELTIERIEELEKLWEGAKDAPTFDDDRAIAFHDAVDKYGPALFALAREALEARAKRQAVRALEPLPEPDPFEEVDLEIPEFIKRYRPQETP